MPNVIEISNEEMIATIRACLGIRSYRYFLRFHDTGWIEISECEYQYWLGDSSGLLGLIRRLFRCGDNLMLARVER